MAIIVAMRRYISSVIQLCGTPLYRIQWHSSVLYCPTQYNVILIGPHGEELCWTVQVITTAEPAIELKRNGAYGNGWRSVHETLHFDTSRQILSTDESRRVGL